MRKINKILILFFVLYNCKTIHKETLYGSYVFSSKVGNEYIELRSDSLFDFESKIPMLESKSSGIWTLKNNYIIINSFPDFKNNLIDFKEISKQDVSSIQILDKNNNPVFGIQISINYKYINSTNLNGVVFLRDIKLNKGDIINISDLNFPIEKSQYKFKNYNNSNSLIINLYPKEYDKLYFKNDTLVFKGNKILFKNRIFKKQ